MRQFGRPRSTALKRRGDATTPTALRPLLVVIAAAWGSQVHAASASMILPLFAIAGLLRILRPWLLEQSIDALEGAVVAWLLAWVASGLLASDVAHAFTLSAPTLVFALAFFILYRDDQRLLELSLGVLALLAMFQVVVLLSATGQPGGPQQWLRERDLPWLLVPNDVVWMVCLWPLWWHACLRFSLAWRWFGGALMTLQVLAFGLMQSRLALLAVFALLLGATLSRTRRRWLPWLTAAAALIAVFVVVSGFGKGLASLQTRLQLWQAAAELWWSAPWFGVGPHGFGLAYQGTTTTAWLDPRHTPWPHQLPLELLANTGLIGFGAFCIMIVVMLRRLRSLRAANCLRPGLAAALLCFAAVSWVEASSLRLWWWMVLAVLLASCRPDRTQQSG